jgi:type I restriction enzyme, R subunit
MVPVGGFGEESTVQRLTVETLAALGWEHVPASELEREPDDVLIERDLVRALLRLNPVVAEKSERIDEVLRPLRSLILSAGTEGVVAVNEELTRWLRGHKTVQFVGTDEYLPVRLIDFDNVENNRLVVSGPGFGHTGRGAEVQYPKPSTQGGSAFDVVLWVNGIPLSVGETKSPTSRTWSWLNGANDVHDYYEAKHPAFFAPNVLSFATEGKEFHYGAVGQPGETWLQWGHTEDPLDIGPLEQVKRSIELLLQPETLLTVLRDFTLYDRPLTEGGRRLVKLIPRYPQVEAVDAIVDRVKDPVRHRGLIWHYQGSGKTLTQAYAALALINDDDLDETPTIICVFDRIDLIQQTATQFKTALPDEVKVKIATSKDDLRAKLATDERGLILTTVFRFKDADEALNTRSNIVVMVDEAHRTQEGTLGADMRAALPNAQFFGLTGTPVSTVDRNTFALFGDPDDDGWVLNRYSQARSIRDGTTVPIHVEGRLVEWHLDRPALEDAFDELADDEGLTVEQREMLARKASRPAVVLNNTDRIRAVCEDIVDHYTAKMAPSGMKAQVVAYDRSLCVAYHDVLVDVIVDRGLDYEAAVVMTTGTGSKSSPEDPEWDRRFGLTDEQEEQLKGRFRDHSDPLTFLVVTSKLLTGFDAPIEGVMYLDKPLRLHTLSQTMARVNRRWTHPDTSVEKAHGLIVDYIGLGGEIKKALRDAQPELADQGGPADTDVDGLAAEFERAITDTLVRFDGIDRGDAGYESMMAAHEQLATQDAKDAFAADMVRVSTLWEFLHPHDVLEPHKDDYRWLGHIYESIKPTTASDALLWRRLGPKTIELVHEHMTVEGVKKVAQEVILDDETIEAIRQLAEQDALIYDVPGEAEPITVDKALDTIARRIQRLLDDTGHHVFSGLADRLERLRERHVTGAKESQEFLQELLDLTRQIKAADKAAQEGTLDEQAETILDPRIGALTQIFEEYAPDDTPVIVGNVVRDIDTLVKEFAFDGWADSYQAAREVKIELRKLLAKYRLPPSGDLFEKAYAYIAENY